MFSYRHIYHAGNFADVYKHVILVGLLKSLQKKDSALYFQDTHAGIGLYDLHSPQAAKNKEYKRGIQNVLDADNPPKMVQDYFDVINAANEGSKLDFYPGSPMVARRLLRPQDRMLLTELNEKDHDQLKRGFFRDSQVAVHLQDAWQGMKAFLPPKQKRGLVLIDPPYELKTEVKDLVEALQTAYRKWPNGIYAIWYPVFEDNFDRRIARKLEDTGIRKILNTQMLVRDAGDGRRMIGTGMLIVNPPWQLDEELKSVLKFLWQCLNEDEKGSYKVNWLVPE